PAMTAYCAICREPDCARISDGKGKRHTLFNLVVNALSVWCGYAVPSLTTPPPPHRERRSSRRGHGAERLGPVPCATLTPSTPRSPATSPAPTPSPVQATPAA